VSLYSLFQISSNPNIEVAKVFVNGQWDIQFRRQLHESQIEEWCRLQSLLEGINLNNDRDRVHWALEKSKNFTVRSLYKNLTTGGVRDIRMMAVWGCDIPLKVKIFI